MKYDAISKELFIKNRTKFTIQMKPNTLAVFNSNDIFPISADSTMPFQQHRDIFYLSGVDQEESILVLFPNAQNENHREILFLNVSSIHRFANNPYIISIGKSIFLSGNNRLYFVNIFIFN